MAVLTSDEATSTRLREDADAGHALYRKCMLLKRVMKVPLREYMYLPGLEMRIPKHGLPFDVSSESGREGEKKTDGELGNSINTSQILRVSPPART